MPSTAAVVLAPAFFSCTDAPASLRLKGSFLAGKEGGRVGHADERSAVSQGPLIGGHCLKLHRRRLQLGGALHHLLHELKERSSVSLAKSSPKDDPCGPWHREQAARRSNRTSVRSTTLASSDAGLAAAFVCAVQKRGLSPPVLCSQPHAQEQDTDHQDKQLPQWQTVAVASHGLLT